MYVSNFFKEATLMASPTKEDIEFILCDQQINDRPLPIYIYKDKQCLVW